MGSRFVRHRQPEIAAGLALIVVVGGCGNDSGRGFTPGPTGPRGTVQLTVEGPPSIAPGTSAQFVASATGTDGTRRDVTTEVTWQLPVGTVFAVTPAGVVTATAVGQATLLATLGSTVASTELVSVPAGTYLLRGQITPVFPTLEARVEILDGPYRGMSANADPTGVYRLFGVAGALQLRASMAGHLPETRALTVNAHAEANFTLAPTAGTTLLGSWTLAVTASTSCPTMRAISPLTAPVLVEQDASGTVVLVGDTGEGPWRFPATIQGTTLNVVLSMSPRDEPDGPGLFVHAVDRRTAQIFGYLTAGTTSPTTLAGSLAAYIFDTSTFPPQPCLGEHAVEMRRR